MSSDPSLYMISPIDGRYRHKTALLQPLLSEYGLFHFRFMIELRWFVFLTKQNVLKNISPLSKEAYDYLEHRICSFDLKDAQNIKMYEQQTNHDVKAVEYYLKDIFKKHAELAPFCELIHFGCTSEDINNLAYACMFHKTCKTILIPQLKQLLTILTTLSQQYQNVVMLGRTHGQVASPTTFGKELANFAYRLHLALQKLSAFQFYGKMNGATGNYNAHTFVFPDIDWLDITASFVRSLDLEFYPYTTQIEPHDGLAEFCHLLLRTNTILLDLARDCWNYAALGYIHIRLVGKEVGSSTMPHKVNPIDFENSEGNIKLANALLGLFSETLPVNRFQRDLSDSTLMRNMGVAIAHSLIAYDSIGKGLSKLTVDEEKISEELKAHWEVLTEGIQTFLRVHGYEKPYEQLQSFSQGKQIDAKMLRAFIDSLQLPDELSQLLKSLDVEHYTGLAKKLASDLTKYLQPHKD